MQRDHGTSNLYQQEDIGAAEGSVEAQEA